MMSDRIVVRKEGHIAWLLFNRPERLNAMTFATWAEFDEKVSPRVHCRRRSCANGKRICRTARVSSAARVFP
jgi:hypothetical protein